MSVGLLIVSHSARIAEGVVELAGQMADGVRIVAAGGTDEGGIGTSFEKIRAGIETADAGEGVVILCDLGSAVLTAETALEVADDASSIRIAAAPIVEGAVAAAVAARVGGDLAAVVAAAESAAVLPTGTAANGRPGTAAEPGTDPKKNTDPGGRGPAGGGRAVRRVRLVNASGLHARPAASFATAASGYDAVITVGGVDAKSLLGVMALGARKGTELELTAEGPDAETALAELVALVESGFGED